MRQRPAGARPEVAGLHRNPQCAEPVVARKKQIFQNGQPEGRFDVPYHALAPSVGAGVVNRTRQMVGLRQELPRPQGQVRAQREALSEPVLCILEHTPPQPGAEVQRAHQDRRRGVVQPEQEHPVLRDVVPRADGAACIRALRWSDLAHRLLRGGVRERTTLRASASAAAKSRCGAAAWGSWSERPMSQSAVA